MAGIALLAVATLIAGTLSAVTGFGGAAILLPLLVAAFGVRDAIPILTVAQLIGNASRVWFNRSQVDWQVVGWFSIGATPAAIAGGLLFASAPLSALTRLLGMFLIAVVVYRHARKRPRKMPLIDCQPCVGTCFRAVGGSHINHRRSAILTVRLIGAVLVHDRSAALPPWPNFPLDKSRQSMYTHVSFTRALTNLKFNHLPRPSRRLRKCCARAE